MQQSASLLGLTGLSLISCSSVGKGDSLITSITALQAVAVRTMKLESMAFPSDGLIPAKYTCDGADISPPLSWDYPPAGTQSLALIVDAPVGIFAHWVLYDIPAEVIQLPERVDPQLTLPNG